jgi:hypothetical protein
LRILGKNKASVFLSILFMKKIKFFNNKYKGFYFIYYESSAKSYEKVENLFYLSLELYYLKVISFQNYKKLIHFILLDKCNSSSGKKKIKNFLKNLYKNNSNNNNSGNNDKKCLIC